MAAILVVPGNNAVLRTIARHLEQREDVLMLATANDALWQARRQPPALILTDANLPDMSGADLAELAPNFAPGARVIVCGAGTSDLAAKVTATGATWLPLSGRDEDDRRAVYAVLGLHAPEPALLRAPEAALDAGGPSPAGTLSQRDVARESLSAPRESSDGVAGAPPADPGASMPAAESAPSGGQRRGGMDFRRGGSALVIQPAQHRHLGQLLALVARETEAQCVLLVDQAGMILVQSGALTGVAMELVAPLLTTTFSATSQLARQLGEDHARAAYIHEGARFDLYAFHLDARLGLLIIFDKRLNAGKLGTVWVYARRAMRQIQQILQL